MSCLSDVASKLSLSSLVQQHPPFISHRETHDHHPSPLSHPTLVEVIKQPGDLIQHMQNTGGSRPQGRHNEDGWHALSTWSFTKAQHIFWLILWELSTWLLRNKTKIVVKTTIGGNEKNTSKNTCLPLQLFVPTFAWRKIQTKPTHFTMQPRGSYASWQGKRCAGLHRSAAAWKVLRDKYSPFTYQYC